MTQPNDEVYSLLRMADQDWEMFLVLKDAPRVGIAGVCFHAQQCIEKILKAMMVMHGLTFERTHNLVALAERLRRHGVDLPVDVDELARLNPCAVIFRYDDREIETVGRDETHRLVKSIRDWSASLIPMPPLEQ
jgi:HEPN domain-containing protein